MDHLSDGFLAQDTAERRLSAGEIPLSPLLRKFALLPWLLLGAVAFVTLSPIGLRPNSGFSPNIERFAAFAAVGFSFALFYPRHLLLIGVLVIGAAIGFELMQALVTSRHARLGDMGFKVLGGVLGIAVGAATPMLARRLRATGS